MFTQTLLTDNTQTCNIIKLSTKFFVKEGRDQFPVILLEASVHRNCTGLEKVQNLIAGTRQLCNSHPEKQLGTATVGVSHSKTPLHKEAYKPPPFWLHMKSPLNIRGNEQAQPWGWSDKWEPYVHCKRYSVHGWSFMWLSGKIIGEVP